MSSSSEYSYIDPDIVYFTHSRIRPVFSGCGRRIVDTINDIMIGRLPLENLPTITVLNCKGAIFSLNNRRLYVLKYLRKSGFLEAQSNVIRVRTKTPLAREIEKYKIENFSITATLMGERDKELEEADGTDGTDGDVVVRAGRLDDASAKGISFASLPEKVKKNYKTMVSLAHRSKDKELRDLIESYVQKSELTGAQANFLMAYLKDDTTEKATSK